MAQISGEILTFVQVGSDFPGTKAGGKCYPNPCHETKYSKSRHFKMTYFP